MPLRKLSKTTSKKLSKHLATSTTYVVNLLDCFIATSSLVVGATYIDIGVASWCRLLDDIITTGSVSKWDYRFGAFPLLGGGLGWGLIYYRVRFYEPKIESCF